MVRDEVMPLDEEFLAEVGKNGDRRAHTERQLEILGGLRAKAKERGLWNFWLTGSECGYGLTPSNMPISPRRWARRISAPSN